MRTTFILFVLTLAILATAFTAHSVNTPVVEVLYVNHPPMQPTISELKKLFWTYGDKIAVSWYDVDAKGGQQFMAKKGMRNHTPIAIWIDESQSVKLGSRTVKFTGFPSGSGAGPFQGDWTINDVKAALDQAITQRR